MRGLKPGAGTLIHLDAGSHAVCVRGLKHMNDDFLFIKPTVARRVRAWIETVWIESINKGVEVARRVRAWIETKNGGGLNIEMNCRTPCACVD